MIDHVLAVAVEIQLLHRFRTAVRAFAMKVMLLTALMYRFDSSQAFEVGCEWIANWTSLP